MAILVIIMQMVFVITGKRTIHLLLLYGKNVMHYDSIASNLLLLFNNPDDEIVTYSNDNRFIINSSSLETMSAESILGTTSVMTEDNAYLSYAKIVDGNRIWLTNEVFVMLKDSVYYTTFMQPIILSIRMLLYIQKEVTCIVLSVILKNKS
jgi:hypothetical protein